MTCQMSTKCYISQNWISNYKMPSRILGAYDLFLISCTYSICKGGAINELLAIIQGQQQRSKIDGG
jgi:hypothetical protein